MSALYFDVTTSVKNSGLVQTNVDKTPKIPLFWSIIEQSEISDRYTTLFDRKVVIVNYNELLRIPLKSGIYKSNTKPLLKISMYATGTVGGTQMFSVSFGGVFVEYELPLNTVTEYEIEVPENTTNIELFNIVNNYLYVFEDYEVVFKTTPITEFNAEFTSFSIDAKLVNSKTLANQVRQRKIGKTEVQYIFQPIITPEQNAEIDDVRDFARLNKFLMLIYINYSETNESTLANFPQESGYIKYFYVNHSTTQKTGLYEYLNLTIANQPNVAIR